MDNTILFVRVLHLFKKVFMSKFQLKLSKAEETFKPNTLNSSMDHLTGDEPPASLCLQWCYDMR